MRTALEYEAQVKASWAECFRPQHKQLYRTLLMMTLQMFQQLTGANYFFYVSGELMHIVQHPNYVHQRPG